jgi:chemotaxis protein MotB
MARRHKHEEHANHEAWAIPYGDLITLLLAFFVVMYAMSSVNEGKYRVLSDSMVAAFTGSPRTMEPIQVGAQQLGEGADSISFVNHSMLQTQPRAMLEPVRIMETAGTPPAVDASEAQQVRQELASVAREVEQSMASLIEDDLIVVRRHATWVEVEIRTDILFPSGVATLSTPAEQVLQQLARTLRPFPNAIRVEGHTDNRPISTRAFPSNWELSAARAGSVVHLFTRAGIDPARLAVIGLGENRPAQSNATPEGRNANRRVLLVILGGDGRPEGDYAGDRGQPEPAPAERPALNPATIEASLQPPIAPVPSP